MDAHSWHTVGTIALSQPPLGATDQKIKPQSASIEATQPATTLQLDAVAACLDSPSMLHTANRSTQGSIATFFRLLHVCTSFFFNHALYKKETPLLKQIVKNGIITSFVLDHVRVDRFGQMYLNK